ncbi:hypothetical protein LDENG_00179840 [Lucifuga dentata]|nr:hypothetical protein LDENG_00179840 [Lucifuga dentata]
MMTLMMKSLYRALVPASPSTLFKARMKAHCPCWRENYFLLWKKTKVTAGPEYAGTWRRRDTSPPPTSKSSWTAMLKVLPRIVGWCSPLAVRPVDDAMWRETLMFGTISRERQL